jgi:rhodanese-related sulfurtransferase
MKIMTKTKVWMLAILFISFIVVSCDEEEDPPVEVNEAELLVEWMESATSPAADYGNSALAIKSAEAVHTAMAADKVYIIDIRSATDFAKGHIDDAVNLAAGDVAAHIDATDLASYDEISIVCYSGQTASWLTCLLRLDGYDNVYSMKFGMCSWADTFAVSWPGAISSEYSTFFVTDATAKGDVGDLPDLGTGLETAEEIFDAQLADVYTEGFGGAAISAAEVYANLDNYYIINYWPEAEYLDPGHIDGAMQYGDLKLDVSLKTLPTDKTIVVYCYTGQNSARLATYLRVLGYDAKSLKFGANTMIYDDMTISKWSDAAIMNYDYWTPSGK